MKKKKEKIANQSNVSGITLIALVITIIVLLLLAGVTAYAFLGKNGIMARTEEAKFKHKMSAIAEQWKLYVADSVAGSLGQMDTKQLYAGGDIIYDVIADEEIEMDTGLIRDIRKLLNEVTETEEKFTMGFEGELYYVSKSSIENNQQQVQWCKEIGIKIWEYKGRADTKVVNGDYKNIKRSIFVYAKIRYRICERKNKIY